MAPFTDCPQTEHCDDAHSAGRTQRADEHAETASERAVTGALHVDERVADNAAGESAGEDRREGNDASERRRKRREGVALPARGGGIVGHRHDTVLLQS